MKKLMIILLALGTTTILQPPLRAQHFYTSYGFKHEWYLPKVIMHNIHWDYPNYYITHVSRIPYPGVMHFNVILQKGRYFYELRYNELGHVISRIRHHHFPLTHHICREYCGYYDVYYHHHIRPHIYVHNYDNGHGTHGHHKPSGYGHAAQHAKKQVTARRKPVEVQSRVNGNRVSGVNPDRTRDNVQTSRVPIPAIYERPQTNNVGGLWESSPTYRTESRIGRSGN